MMTEATLDLPSVWQQVLSALDGQEMGARDRAYLRLSHLMGVLDSTALVAVPYQHTKETLESGGLGQALTEALTQALGREIHLAVTVHDDLRHSIEDESGGVGGEHHGKAPGGSGPPPTGGQDAAPANAPYQERTPLSGMPAGAVPTTEAGPRLNPKYTFDSFVSGSSNRFAHAASLAVAESPARAYNPLFIYGESGLGKTHLLHAIGHYTRNLYPGMRVRYVNSEEFTNDFINSIRDDKATAFQARYRSVDLLLIDDIQFLQGKEQTVEEFFHTFNTLHNSQKQVVITSDQAPKKLSGFAERMRSRFEWGLLTDVQPPDLETRIAILRKKAALEGMSTPDDVLEFIGSKISTNIRELEGALIRVTAFGSLSGEPVSVDLASHVLKDIIPSGEAAQISSGIIITETADYFRISIDDLTGPSRSRTLVNARQIAMYLCRELTDLSLPKIGDAFGRDHTTVMHAERKIRQQIGERRALYDQITELTANIRRAATRLS